MLRVAASAHPVDAAVIVMFLVSYIVVNPLFFLGCHVCQGSLSYCRGREPRCPHLFVCTHDYEHIDLFVAKAEMARWYGLTGRATYMVVADMLHNRLYDSLFPKCGRCLYVTRGPTGRMLERLRDHNVCIFIYRHATGTGVHHVISSFNGPVLLTRIVSDVPYVENHDACAALRRCCGRQFRTSYTLYDKAPHMALSPAEGMQCIKGHLYPCGSAAVTDAHGYRVS